MGTNWSGQAIAKQYPRKNKPTADKWEYLDLYVNGREYSHMCSIGASDECFFIDIGSANIPRSIGDMCLGPCYPFPFCRIEVPWEFVTKAESGFPGLMKLFSFSGTGAIVQNRFRHISIEPPNLSPMIVSMPPGRFDTVIAPHI